MKELIRVRVQYASRQQCCKTHKRPLPFTFFTSALPKGLRGLWKGETYYLEILSEYGNVDLVRLAHDSVVMTTVVNLRDC